jgi:hypothetical protein
MASWTTRFSNRVDHAIVDRELTRIRVDDHKTDSSGNRWAF